ncbi:MAG: helix-turn-helix transcriptional regulator [Ktedonobacteraceae bacterium]|nr:helix-turn-helix transcriptional regulator [Ktedonobacteraceae bacterium]MBO0790248.1 helix-turn-helix transcriptional regulator [Ktedonobacteraceae bacterium]
MHTHVVPHSASTLDFEQYLPTSPVLSSRERGWESVMVRAYHEPSNLEETLFPGGPDIYLVLVTSGSVQGAERRIDGPWKNYQVQAGDWFLTPAGGEPYALRWKSLSSEPLKTLHLHLSANLFTRTVQEVGDRDPLQVMVQERTGLQDPLLTHLALSLQQELQAFEVSAVSNLYAETAAQMLATHLLRHYATTEVGIREYDRKLSSRQVRNLTLFVADHLSENLSLEALAQQVGFSSYHFARLFRQTTGESPHQFVLRQRLAAAERLLQESALSLAQIASEVGIPNQSYFTQAFKRYRGMTPLVYRQRH